MDLADKDPGSRQVYYDAAQEFANQNGLFFFEAMNMGRKASKRPSKSLKPMEK